VIYEIFVPFLKTQTKVPCTAADEKAWNSKQNPWISTKLAIILKYGPTHRLNMEVDLQSLFGLNVT
jgi:hypothetical protein